MRTIVIVAVSITLLTGCKQAGETGVAEVTNGTEAGGIVRFSGVTTSIVVDVAEEYCRERRQKSALPINFYRIGADKLGIDQIMTFECK